MLDVETIVFVCLVALQSGGILLGGEAAKRPNIVLILADDLGWNDVSFHGSNQIPTPNIDALAYSGVILNSHYSQALCSPSRAALLTGKYPIRTGMQHNVILAPEPWGLPKSERLLPEHLKTLGYATHMVGKWHLGYYKKEYTPTYRGFDSHYGFWNGYQDYYNHTVQASFQPYEGYDMRRDLEVDWTAVGNYTTDIFTREAVTRINSHKPSEAPLFLYLAHLAPHAGNYEEPLQAPQDYIDRFMHIADPERRIYAAMVSKLDDSIGSIVEALGKNAMLENTIIVFTTDNGAITRGIHSNHGSNWPLRGVKGTPWEGGVRTISFVWSQMLTKSNRVSNALMHLTDWMPTLYSAAGGSLSDLGAIDGFDMWSTLSRDTPSPRYELLINIDDIAGYSALRIGNYKYINGTVFLGYLDGWTGDQGNTQVKNTTDVLRDIQQSIAWKTLQNLGKNIASNEANILKLRRDLHIRCDKLVSAKTKYPPCRPQKQPCLFDLENDPCEKRNLYNKGTGEFFEGKLKTYRENSVPPNNMNYDIKANPSLWNNTWMNWGDIDSIVVKTTARPND